MAQSHALSNPFSSSNLKFEEHHSLLCLCGRNASLRCSWKPTNPGRRFYGCGEMKCNFFRWHDPEMCERSKVLIPAFLKKTNNLEAKVEILEKKLKKQGLYLLAALFALALVLLMMVMKSVVGMLVV